MLLIWLTLFAGVESAGPILEATLGNEDLAFGAGATVAVDDRGRLFVLDPSSYNVRVFDRDLNEQNSFGRRGKGPGEFEEPKVVALFKGNPCVFDPTLKRLTVFKPTGEVLRTVRLDASSVTIYHPAMLRDQRVAFLGARSHAGKPVYDLSIFDGDAKAVANLVRIQAEPLDWAKSSQPSFWATFLQNEFELLDKGMPAMCALDENTLVFARTNRYYLTMADADGKTLRTISRDLKPMPLTDELKMAAFEHIWNRLTADPLLFNQMPRKVFERAAANAKAPPALPVIHAMASAADGFVVLANYHNLTQRGLLDIFDREGNLKQTLNFQGPADFLVGTRTHLYAVGADAEDVIVINRFRLP